MSLQTQSAIRTGAVAAGRTGALLQVLLAAGFGVMLLGVVGFSHLEVIHNAAHDTRHSNGFPCH